MQRLLVFFLCFSSFTAFGQSIYNPSADITGDGCIAVDDLLILLGSFGSCQSSNTDCGVVSFSGYDYATVAIGAQCWFKENLQTQTFLNGDSIPYVESPEEWTSTPNAAYCFPSNDAALTEDFGLLYNWWTVNDYRGICPNGWHVPDNADWTELRDFLGDNPGIAMKSNINDPVPWNGSNSSGFSAVPAGYRSDGNGNWDMGAFYNWMWSTNPGGVGGYQWSLVSNGNGLGSGYYGTNRGKSVRCIKDE